MTSVRLPQISLPTAISMTLIACLSFLTASCDGRRAPDSTASNAEIVELISTESGVLGNIADLFLGSEGQLYVADYQNSYVLKVDTASGTFTQIGRQGSGPSEFQQPTAVRELDGELIVFDSRNGRIVKLARDGQMLGSVPIHAFPYAPTASIDSDGWVVTATGGFEHGLAVLMDHQGNTVRGYGQPVPLPQSFTTGDVKLELRGGRVPAMFQNNVVPARAHDGSVYLAMMANPEIRRYAAPGDLIWSVTLSDPVHDGLRAGYVQRNLDEGDPNRVHPFRYFADLQVERSSLWLLGSPDAGDVVLWELDPENGEVRARYAFAGESGVTALFVDAPSRTVFLGDNDLGRLLKGRLGANTVEMVAQSRE